MDNIFGDLKKLSPKQKVNLSKLLELRSIGSEICEPNLARRVALVVDEVAAPIGLLVSREGRIVHVILGTKQRLYLPDLGRFRLDEVKLRRLRLVVFWPAGNLNWCDEHGTSLSDDKLEVLKNSNRSASDRYYPQLQADFVTDLEKLRLDCVLLVAVTQGSSKSVVVATHSTEKKSSKSRSDSIERRYYSSLNNIDIDFPGYIGELERFKRSNTIKAKELNGELAVLVGAYTTSQKDFQYSIDELSELTRSAGLTIADIFIQRRRSLDPRTVIGKGKIEELMLRALDLGADLLIFDCELSPSQLREISKITEHRILDRSMLILDIFAQRAKSSEGKLQVELAQLKYNLPRLTDKDSGLSRLTGGVGGRGPGETKLEVSRRSARDRIVLLEKKIDHISKQRQLRRSKRHDRGVPIVGIVGYTNAGKSSLLNSLSKSDVFAEDKLFATLDPSSRRMRFPNDKEVVFVDTVGFIRNLPKELLGAFRATLEELSEADILLHVVDVSNIEIRRHVEVVNKTIKELGHESKPTILVLNKCDLLSEPEVKSIQNTVGGIAVSALTRSGLSVLISNVIDLMNSDLSIRDPGAFLEYEAQNPLENKLE